MPTHTQLCKLSHPECVIPVHISLAPFLFFYLINYSSFLYVNWLPKNGRKRGFPHLSSFHTIYRNLRSTIKSILRGFAKRGFTQDES
jgi:hypothetical protein